MIQEFKNFKDKKQSENELLIDKVNSQSMKIVYKKYLAYVRYLVFQKTRY